MKIKPTAQGWLGLSLVLALCLMKGSIIPLLIAFAFLAVLTPICIWLHFWNERENEKIVAEFPFDLEIRRKYGRKQETHQ